VKNSRFMLRFFPSLRPSPAMIIDEINDDRAAEAPLLAATGRANSTLVAAATLWDVSVAGHGMNR
jgi:hypothetical protein